MFPLCPDGPEAVAGRRQQAGGLGSKSPSMDTLDHPVLQVKQFFLSVHQLRSFTRDD